MKVIIIGLICCFGAVEYAEAQLRRQPAEETRRKQVWHISGKSIHSYENAMSKIRIPAGFTLVSYRYLRQSGQYVVIAKIREM